MKRLPRGIPLWLRILPVKGVGSNPGQGTKVPYAMGCSQFFFNSKKKKNSCAFSQLPPNSSPTDL